jgi:cation diffusion facilitator CzcD-associated flavoprotein CzcO
MNVTTKPPPTFKLEAVHPDPSQAHKMPYAPAIKIVGACDLMFLSGATASPLYHNHPHQDHEHVHPHSIEEQTKNAMNAIKSILDSVGATWRRHYDRLHLHTPKAFSALPDFAFPKTYPRYPAREQVISYLEAYAQHFALEPKFGQQVVAARAGAGGWEVETQDTRYQAPNLVIATGGAREPYMPTWPGQADFQGQCLHSSAYRNGEPFRNQKVLVVGFGNSGGEIALDLWEHGAHPSMAVRSAVNVIPRDIVGIPNLAFSIVQNKLPRHLADTLNAPIVRLTIGDLTPYGLRRPAHGPLAQIERDARIPLIDVGTVDLIKRGDISVYPGIERFTIDGITFTDGRQAAFDAVILATGYRPRVNTFLEGVAAAYDAEGTPLASGHELAASGLYFCGFYVAPTGMLREIAPEARRISATIAQKSSQ